MDYKEKYENLVEAVKKLQEVNPSDEGIQNWINDNVPELQESEDEKMRKAIIEHFAGAHSSMYPYKGFTKEQILAWIEKQGQQDKVKPKFHKGEWIVFNGLTLYIGEDKSFYGTTTKDGINNTYDYWDIDNVARLWTIEDAKDGDVLYLQHDGKEHIIIYKGVMKERFRIFVSAYCAYNGIVDAFCFADVGRYTDIAYGGIMPATKEQRDALMKAMADAGYTFDFEKKELRKIEQKPTAWSEEDKNHIETLLLWLRVSLGHEDKSLQDKINIEINWLKSLKERVQPQPKQEWSEEDEKTIHLACEFIRHHSNRNDSINGIDCPILIERLKSLRPQSLWKPSEGQMVALNCAITAASDNFVCLNVKDLESLYEDLKKLKN